MNNPKITDYISSRIVLRIRKVWIPVILTVSWTYALVSNSLHDRLDSYELASYTFFQIMWISVIWIWFYFGKEYSNLHEWMTKQDRHDRSLFDDLQEQTFQSKLKKRRIIISVLVVALLLLEGFRLLSGIVTIPDIVLVAVYIVLLLSSIIFYILSVMSSLHMLAFMKSITYK